MTQLYVANTDNEWFDFLRARAPWPEVNFWKPTQQVFRAIEEGGLFVFRLKSPRNVIGGYGMLVSSVNAPIELAWQSFGEANGLPSAEAMVSRIAQYRKSRDTNIHSLIGCRLLAEPVFFDDAQWFDVPADWSSNIVTGKVYDALSDEGEKLLGQLEARTSAHTLFERSRREFDGFTESEQSRYGAPTTVLPRLGQGAFSMKVASAYEFACAVTSTRVLPTLEAAHIRPYSKGGVHSLGNGIFLRRDIHSVIDSGLATFDDDLHFVVSPKVKEIYNNGNEYLRLAGTKIRLPASASDWPSTDNLRWHRENCYLG